MNRASNIELYVILIEKRIADFGSPITCMYYVLVA